MVVVCLVGVCYDDEVFLGGGCVGGGGVLGCGGVGGY